MNTETYLNALCARTNNPSVLNALHACRSGHPLGRHNPYKWRTAYGMIQQHTVTFLMVEEVEFLGLMAAVEAKNALEGKP
jgi:hypothetical protein